MKIIVTGGAGFIASHIVDAYVSQGHQIVILDNLSTGKKENLNKKAKFINVDIRNGVKIRKIFEEYKPDILNHHAAQLNVRRSVDDPVYDAEVNIIGLLNLLESGRRSGVKKVIFSSSGGVVYGDAAIIPTSEEYQPLRPISPYGVTKLASENYLYYYFKIYGLPYIALRYANVYGPRQDPLGEAGVLAIFTEKLLKGEQPVINGEGKQTRDYVYVGDIVRANVLALTAEEVGCFNIGTGIETNVNQTFKILVNLTNTNFSEKHGPAKIGEQKRSCLNINKAIQKLRWKPLTNINDGMNKTVNYFRNIYGK